LPNPFRKISDYDRLAEELEEVKARLAEVNKELEDAREELRKTIGQFEHSQERVKEERRRRADEEARRGAVEKQLGSMQEEISSLQSQLRESREIAAEPERIAVLEREADLEQDGVLTFLHETDFEPGQPCITVAVPPIELEAYLEGVPGMGAWISRIAKDERGLFAFFSGRKACFLEPPLPVREGSTNTGEGFDLGILDPYLKKPLVGFMSLHRDSYAFGIIDGEVRESTFEEKDVIGKTKKGGFSQARYSRSRDDQFKHLLTEASDRASKLFLDSGVEYIFVEGDERAISALIGHEGISEGRQIIRFTVPGKMGKAISGRLPGYIWSWKAWAFSLPGHVD
jgi:hypothetical protein